VIGWCGRKAVCGMWPSGSASITPRKAGLRESWMRENCTSSLNGGRKSAREQSSAPPPTRQAASASEGPNGPRDEHLMEAICDPENVEAALRTVTRNKGAPGVDGITVRQLPAFSAQAGRRSKINYSGVAISSNRSFGCKSRNRPAGRATSAFQPRLVA
jgi:hypothetical protein